MAKLWVHALQVCRSCFLLQMKGKRVPWSSGSSVLTVPPSGLPSTF